jgi:hypothetical protein
MICGFCILSRVRIRARVVKKAKEIKSESIFNSLPEAK